MDIHFFDPIGAVGGQPVKFRLYEDGVIDDKTQRQIFRHFRLDTHASNLIDIYGLKELILYAKRKRNTE